MTNARNLARPANTQRSSRSWIGTTADSPSHRRNGGGIVQSGGRPLRTGDVALLGDDTIHAVANPRTTFTGAIHVYGGNITNRPGRSEWEEPTLREVDYDFAGVRQYFEETNAALLERARASRDT